MNDVDAPRTWSPGRIAAVSIVVALALMWIYVLFIASSAPSDTLDSKAFPTAAEPVCAATVARLKDLNLVNQFTPTPQQRADLVDRTNAELTAMVAALRQQTPPSGDDRTAVTKWLGDWDQWLADRAAWSAKLHAGENVQFFEKQDANGDPNSKALNAFAITNGMQDCQTPVGV